MVNKKVLTIFLLIYLIMGLTSEEKILTDVSKFQGTFLPLKFINSLIMTQSYKKALDSNLNYSYHHIIMINNKYISGAANFSDSYGIDLKSQLIMVKTDNQYYLKDLSGNKYFRISKKHSDDKLIDIIIRETQLDTLLNNKNCYIENNKLHINNNEYKFNFFYPNYPEDIDFIFIGKNYNEYIGIKNRADHVIIYNMKIDSLGVEYEHGDGNPKLVINKELFRFYK